MTNGVIIAEQQEKIYIHHSRSSCHHNTERSHVGAVVLKRLFTTAYLFSPFFFFSPLILKRLKQQHKKPQSLAKLYVIQQRQANLLLATCVSKMDGPLHEPTDIKCS